MACANTILESTYKPPSHEMIFQKCLYYFTNLHIKKYFALVDKNIHKLKSLLSVAVGHHNL